MDWWRNDRDWWYKTKIKKQKVKIYRNSGIYGYLEKELLNYFDYSVI